MKMSMSCLALFLTAIALSPDMARAGEVFTVPQRTLWCSNAHVPRGSSDEEYNRMLTKAVERIDAARGTGTATGTPFVAEAANHTDSHPTAEGGTMVDEATDVSVCAVVPDSAAVAGTDVRRMTREAEQVFAAGCPIANAAACVEAAFADLAQRLGDKASLVAAAYWWSVRSRGTDFDTQSLARALTATEARRVVPVAATVPLGDKERAAVLTLPIEEQKPRALMTKRPSWLETVSSPGDKGIVVAISLTKETLDALNSVQQEGR